MNSGIIVCEPGESDEHISNEVDTLRSKLKIVGAALDQIVNGKYSTIDTPKAIARQLQKQLGLEKG